MKKINLIGIIAIIINILISPVIASTSVEVPVDTSVNFITSATINDGNGNNLAGSTVSDSTKVKFEFNFEVSNDYRLIPGEKFIMDIDPIIKYRTGNSPINLTFNDTSIGTVDVSEGKAIITFNDSIKNLINIKGEFSFWSNFDKTQIDYVDGNNIRLPTSENSDSSVHLNFIKDNGSGSSGDSVISKRLNSYDKIDPTIINWGVTINNAGDAIDNSFFIDQMEPGMDYIQGSTTIKYRNYKGVDGILKTDNSDLNFIRQSDGSTKVTINFGELTSKASLDKEAVTSISINYQTRIVDNGNLKRYPNHAYSYDGDIQLGNANSTASWRGQEGGGYGDNSTTISGSKIWEDNNDINQKRPEYVIIHLLRNGKQFLTRSASKIDNWRFEFSNLAIKDPEGTDYVYTLSEEPVPGYSSKIDGTDIINTIVDGNMPTQPEVISLTGHKIWIDNGNSIGIRPESITVNLFANGEKIDSKIVTASNNWNYKFTNLPTEDNNRIKIKYSISEKQVAGYMGEVVGNNIVNTLIIGNIPIKPTLPDSNSPNLNSNFPSNLEAASNNVSNHNTKNKTLPATGTRVENNFPIIGVIILLITVGLIILKK